MESETENENHIDEFESGFLGDLIRPEDSGYDDARAVWNGMIDKRPDLVARCQDVADVISAVEFARDRDLLVAVRGGGHNAAGLGTCDDGIVIDLSPINWMDVDPDARRVRVGGGATWRDVDHATQAFGLAVPGGVVSHTGVAGLTLGGGYGHLRRQYGLTCDNLVSVDLITADGRYLAASEDEHSDLFWAVRGGGGTFGIVTAFEFEAHPIGIELATVETWHPIEDATAAFEVWRDFVETAPPEVSGEAIIWGIPEDPHFPEEHHDDPVAIITAVYCGDPEEGENRLRPLREFGSPLLDFSGRTRYLDLQQGFDPFFPAGEHRYYQGSIYLDSLDDETITKIVEREPSRPDPRILYYVWNLGGAIADVPEHATAFSGREHPYLLAIDCKWDDPEADEAVLDWARSFQRDMDVHSPGESYRNFPGLGETDDIEPERSPRRDETADRLVELKDRYDPTNVFSRNHGVRPSESARTDGGAGDE
ncbi:FAD-binding oxidoreductase [Natrarchaeobius oligotrophus]|uniref:FAD-binding oxidoreductase n=1 Tax=Natrarchaeobius chitinivorans TaxID=1679083 RepID=A0A3N6MMG0_NATCH|nr:FAD-binding oxidoreductase [Natrarchaeobius chitinivorans]RQG98590.1 FAD-binding oxidoreductase [Natrarchaeobius chitinivorans]